MRDNVQDQPVTIPADDTTLDGNLIMVENALGLVLFAHGSGSSRLSPRNRQVANDLNKNGFATLLFDLLTPKEEEIDSYNGEFRFDIPFLSRRLINATDWVHTQPSLNLLRLAYFCASTGAGAALMAVEGRTDIKTVISRGGRPDLVGGVLRSVTVPTLLIVGGDDPTVIDLNMLALQLLGSKVKRLEIIPGATHLFEEPGKLEQVSRVAVDWLKEYV